MKNLIVLVEYQGLITRRFLRELQSLEDIYEGIDFDMSFRRGVVFSSTSRELVTTLYLCKNQRHYRPIRVTPNMQKTVQRIDVPLYP